METARPMARRAALVVIALAVWPAGPRPAAAQESRPPEEGELELVFEREVFTYPAFQRRDPFAPLATAADAGPRFEDLVLLGVIYSPDPDRSVALLGAGDRTYRVRRGQVLGHTRILEIQPTRIIVEVEEFGLFERHVLELRKRAEGAPE